MKDTPAKIDLCIVIPVYNEQDAIGNVLNEWVAMLDSLYINYQLHCYNDGSKDQSADVLERAASEHQGKVVVINKSNSGHGPTILRGYRETASKANWIFQMDSDNEMGSSTFGKLWAQREEYDFLLGRRSGRAQPLPRKVISKISRLVVRCFYGASVWDVNAPYRLMRSEVFQELYNQIPDDTFAPNVIISGFVGRNKLRYYEVGVEHQDRQTGEVSIKKWKLFKAAMRSFKQTILFSFKKA